MVEGPVFADAGVTEPAGDAIACPAPLVTEAFLAASHAVIGAKARISNPTASDLASDQLHDVMCHSVWVSACPWRVSPSDTDARPDAPNLILCPGARCLSEAAARYLDRDN